MRLTCAVGKGKVLNADDLTRKYSGWQPGVLSLVVDFVIVGNEVHYESIKDVSSPTQVDISDPELKSLDAFCKKYHNAMQATGGKGW